MNEFNKMFIDTEELQSEITKLRNSIINSMTNKDKSDTAVVKSDISDIKSSNDGIKESIKDINNKIANLKAKAKELTDKGDRTTSIETKFNNANTQLTARLDEIKREITDLNSNIIPKINNKDEE